MTVKSSIQIIIGTLFASIFLWLILQHISLHQVANDFKDSNQTFLLYAFLAFLLDYSCRIQRWRLMLKNYSPDMRWRNCAGPLMASVAANNILPLRTGDIIRAFGFNKRLKLSATISITTLIVERLLDMLMVITIFGLALAYFKLNSSLLIGIGGAFIIATAIIILFILLFPTLFRPHVFNMAGFLVRIFPAIGIKVINELQKIFSALEYMAKGHTMPGLLFWSLLAWTAEGFVYWFSALSLPVITHHQAAWLALPLGTLATIIPSTPGYVGTFDFFTSKAMIALGNSEVASISYALFVHVLLWIPATLIGGVYLLLHPVKIEKRIDNQ